MFQNPVIGVDKFSKRILYITTVDNTIYAFLIPHIKSLQKRGYKVEVACKLGKFESQIRAEGIKTHHIPFDRNMFSIRNAIAFINLLRLLYKRRYHLVHVHTPIAAFLGRLATKLAGAKTLYTAHGYNFIKGGSKFKNVVFIFLEKISSFWTDGLIVINSEDYEAAKRYKLAPNGKCFLVRGVGVDVNKFNPNVLTVVERKALKRELECDSDKIVGLIAEFNSNKRQIDLLNAAERILQEYKRVTFLFVGDGPLLAKLKLFVDSKWYKNNIKFLGWREDIPQLLSIMDVLVLPSLREGLPRCIQEAMATAVPVVATNTKGNRDLVKHEKTGLLIPPKNPEAMAQAILKLLKNEELAKNIGKRARESVVSDLNLDKIIEQTISIQEKLWGKKS